MSKVGGASIPLKFCGTIAQDKAGFVFLNQKVLIFFTFFHENRCCGYLLEAP